MADDFRIDEEGMRQLRAHIFDNGLMPVARDILADAKRAVPIDTGELHDSLGIEERPEEQAVLIGSSDAEYSTYVELGTSKMAAQPYLRPALYQNRKIARGQS